MLFNARFEVVTVVVVFFGMMPQNLVKVSTVLVQLLCSSSG
jgi:hypothetical protein